MPAVNVMRLAGIQKFLEAALDEAGNERAISLPPWEENSED